MFVLAKNSFIKIADNFIVMQHSVILDIWSPTTNPFFEALQESLDKSID